MSDNLNKDELEAPELMNKSFFEVVLKKCENTDSIQVIDVKMSPASVKGDHMASIMFRGKITFDSNKGKGLTKSLIIKAMPQEDGVKMVLLKESFVFETEIAMYAKTIPMFEAELRKIGDNTVLGPKALFSSLTPHKCIIIEDLVTLGYETLPEIVTDLTNSKAAFLKLAKWHAASYKLSAEGNTSLTEYREGLFKIKDFLSSPLMQDGMKNFIETCETIAEFQSYIPKLREIEKDLLKRCVESVELFEQKNPEGIFVLCHGDYHLKNLMFKRNSKSQNEDVMLLDFQLCFYGPAILDILYAMYLLVNENVRKNHHDELIYYYSSNFIETLKKMKFKGDIPKVADFFIEILRHRHFEIFLISTFLPVCYTFDKEVIDPLELTSSKDLHKRLCKNEDFLNEMKRLLPMMVNRGYLE